MYEPIVENALSHNVEESLKKIPGSADLKADDFQNLISSF